MNKKPSTSIRARQALYILTLVAIGLALPACHHKSTLKDMSWLIGTWEGRLNGNTTYEKWSRLNDTTYHATAARSLNNVVSETQTMSPYARHDTLMYEIAPGGNDSTAQPLTYVLSDDANVKVFSFQNGSKSFPSVIRYQRMSDDSMTVTLSGKLNKTFQSMTFPYRRAKDL